jgi:dethiobiotin synthetase
VSRDFFVTGTDTGVGKTLLSAVLVAGLRGRYWKPIQTGAGEGTDRETVMRWTDISPDRTYPESYIFAPPVSPHLAAEQQGIRIDLGTIQLPVSPDPIIIEGAGGVFVPINSEHFMSDLIRHLGVPVVVAARAGLGTINHTLLTISALRGANLDLRGVVMIGHENADNRQAVERYGKVPVVGSIPWLDDINHLTLSSIFEKHFDSRAFV